jgi:hypothetical protein
MNIARKYIIYSPEYTKSNGVRALYTLHDRLRAQGYEAYIFCLGSHIGDYHYLTEVSRAMRENDIVVYPEVVAGNPLRFHRVVRWVLFFPGELGGAKTYHPGEVLFTWSKSYMEAPLLTVPSIDTSLFFDEGLPKMQDCCFVHKGGRWRHLPELEGLLEINMTFPETREHLARVLKTTGTLYSFDSNSLLNAEARLCGAKVKLVNDDGLIDYTDSTWIEDTLIFDHQLDFFVETTQSLGPDDRIEKILATEKLKIIWRYLYLLVCLPVSAMSKTPRLKKKITYFRQVLKGYGLPTF